MAKVVVFKEDTGDIIEVAEEAEGIEVKGNDVKWINGGFLGIKHPFKFFPDDCAVSIGENISEYVHLELELNTKTREDKLQEQVATMQKVINTILFS